MQEMTETAGYLESHSKSLCNLGATNFSFRPRISDRPFSEARKVEWLSYSVLAGFNSHFSWCPACPDQTVCLLPSVETRAVLCPIGQFCQEENKLLMECLQCPPFSQKQTSTAMNSRVSHQQNSKLLKHLNAIFCRSLKCLKIASLCRIHLYASRKHN